MRKIERLKHEARESATWRGHSLSRFSRGYYGASAECKCGCSVSVSDKPPANGCEIMGDAVAINCKDDWRVYGRR